MKHDLPIRNTNLSVSEDKISLPIQKKPRMVFKLTQNNFYQNYENQESNLEQSVDIIKRATISTS